MSEVSQKLDASRTSIYEWLKAYLVEGEEGLRPQWKGGRPSGLTGSPAGLGTNCTGLCPVQPGSQKKQLADMVKAGPAVAGFVAGGWNSVMIQEMIWRGFGVLYNVHYVCDLLKNLGVFPTDDSVRKLLYLAHRNIAHKWTMPIPNWAMILNQLVVYFQGRIVIR